MVHTEKLLASRKKYYEGKATGSDENPYIKEIFKVRPDFFWFARDKIDPSERARPFREHFYVPSFEMTFEVLPYNIGTVLAWIIHTRCDKNYRSST